MHHIRDYLTEQRNCKIIISTEDFYPTDEKKKDQILIKQHSELLRVQLFSLAWYNVMYNVKYGMLEDHINDTYKSIMLACKKQDLDFFNTLSNIFSSQELYNLRTVISNIVMPIFGYMACFLEKLL